MNSLFIVLFGKFPEFSKFYFYKKKIIKLFANKPVYIMANQIIKI